jgi:subtilisin family serine protease
MLSAVALALAVTLSNDTALPHQLLLKLNHEQPLLSPSARVASLPASKALSLSLRRRSVLGWLVVNVPGDVDEAVAMLRADKSVVAAQPIGVHKALLVPDDEFMTDLWGFEFVGAADAWDITQGVSSQRIGIVDTGLARDHVDFIGRDVAGYDFIDDVDNAADGDGRDAEYFDNVQEGNFHGSHVAGTIGARANDGVGVPGLNWNAGLVSVRALGASGSGSLLDIGEGTYWLAGGRVDGVPDIGANRVSVVNLSLGSSGPCSEFEQDVMTAVIAAGVSVVASAGNDGNDVATGAPASCTGVVAVGAVDRDGNLASYSNFSDRIDIIAPGGSGVAGPESDVLSVDGRASSGWVAKSGTSMASPHVAGVVSLMQAVNPELTPAQIRTLLASSASFTCGGCANKAFLGAAEAIVAAQATTGNGNDDNNDNTADGCPLNSSPVDDGCACDVGFAPNPARDACVAQADEPTPDDGCPANASPGTGEDADTCFCDVGFAVNADRSACEPAAVIGDNNDDDQENEQDEQDEDDEEDEDDDNRRRSRRSDSSALDCSASSFRGSWLFALTLLLFRRKAKL